VSGVHRALLFTLALTLLAQDTRFPPQSEQLPGPPAKADTAAWLAEITNWRSEVRVRAGLSGAAYARPEFQWAQSSFMQPQVMVEDRYLYDPQTRRYTVDRFLDDLTTRYGGIDSILLWPVYPNIGIDNRNQFDLLRDLPGGIPGLKQLVDDFHRRNVRVLFPTMPWDTGSRQEPGGMPNAIASLMAAIGADGVNGDTFSGIPRSYREASDATAHPVVLEPENALAGDEMLNWDNMSWGYWQYPFIPMVSRYKWLEPHHMVNVCDRWNRDKTNNLQFAFFNGVGYETWENIWGIWNGITARDAEAIRRVARIERQFADFLVSPQWEPHTPTIQYGVFASRFPRNDKTLWTIVNRGQINIDGPQLQVPNEPGMRYFDLWHGVELKPDNRILSFEIEAQGYGAVLAQLEPPDAAFLAAMQLLSAKPLSAFPKQWTFLPQQLAPIAPTASASQTPEGMLPVPAARFDFTVNGIEIEGSDDIGVDIQYPWEDSPRRHHSHPVDIHAFFIDKTNVTNRQFKAFLDATHYRPADDHNFLQDWTNNTYPEGWAEKPVTWVSLEDAREYAKWAGKRLPHEWEWQYAAQGTDARIYPWGNTVDATRMRPQVHGHNLTSPAEPIPSGASPFGVLDLAGNIWQWTDEVLDNHTRAAILRGGGYYRPDGSRWYFPSAYRLDQHGKYLLMSPGKDRSGTVGFRCVKDAA
jgi:formylglycine-generating enzyme required for sulfatase activity